MKNLIDSESAFTNNLSTLSDDEIIGAKITLETLKMLVKEYGVYKS